MGYLIKYDDIRHVRERSGPDIGKAVETLTKLKKKIEELNAAQSFRGESAESIKKYMQEVHFSLIGSIIGLLQLYSSKLLLYCDDYYQYDSDKHAVISEDVIDFLLSDVPKRIRNFESCCSYFSDDVRSISDLFDPNNPDISCIESEMKYIDEELISYDSGVKYQESLYKDVSDMETLLNSINTSINEYDSKARSRLLTYNQGDYFKSENTALLFNNYKVSMEYFNQRNFEGKLEAANNHQAAVYKEIQKELEEQQRKQQAVWQIASGTLLFVGGALCIVFTAGAAAPLVIGGITAFFGSADIISGVQTIQHNGDASFKTFNDSIIKNVFRGNEKAFNITKQAFVFASSACIPIAGAYSASTLTIRSGATILAKEVAGVGVGYGTDWLSKKAGLNQSQSIILGMITSFGTSKGLNSIDKKFNVSGFNKVPESPKIQGDVGNNAGNIGNPSENPKVLADAFEDPTTVYGYKPNETGSLKEFAKYDWSNPDVVAEFRSNRIDYISEHNTYQKLFETMKTSSCTDTEIAQALVSERNMSRLASYIDDSGQIIDTDLYNQAVEHCVSYKDLRNGFGGKLPKTDLEIIESAMRTNQAMDACCGLYGHNN